MTENTVSKKIEIDTGAQRVLSVQAMLVSLVAWGFYAYQGIDEAQAALYGGCITMFNVWLTNRRVHAAAQIAEIAPGKEINVLYVAAIQRFVFTIAFFILGMWLLELPPIPMLVTFAVAQVGYFFKGSNNLEKNLIKSRE